MILPQPEDTASPGSEGASSSPVVSVIVPAYNAAGFIAEALDSVFAQSFADLEVIVVNDGSPDTTDLERVLQAYRGRIVYLVQENRGPSGARNRAIREARGEYVALLDSDDVWLPAFLSEQLAAFHSDPSIDLVYSNAELFGDSPLSGRTFMELTPSRGPVTLEALLSFRCMVATSTVVARRQRLIDAGLFDEGFTHSEDFDLWLRVVAGGGRITYTDRVLMRHRMHRQSLAASDVRLFAGQIAVMKKARETLDLAPALRAVLDARLRQSEANLALEAGRAALIAGDFPAAREHLAAANRELRDLRIRLTMTGLSVAPALVRRVLLARRRLLERTTG
jgi:glycosyltransferase involved in cell wall biosynthesis